MAPSRPDDQSLLDRLNALKPTAVTFEKPPAIDPILPASDAQPVSREDALAARLRVLRSHSSSSRRETGASQDDGLPQTRGTSDGKGVVGTAASPPADLEALGDRSVKERPAVPQSASSSTGAARDANQKRPSYHFVDAHAEDEAAVDELLEALGDEDFDLAADEGTVPPPDFDPSDEAKRTDHLLKSLQQGSRDTHSREENTASEDDDSDGEQMTRAVETILSQIGDEISSLPPPSAAVPSGSDGHAAKQPSLSGQADNRKSSTTAKEDGDDDGSALSLPAVPSQLVDPAPDTLEQGDDFERDISARMASLRGLGSLDALGLPSAPTFQPQDHNPSSTVGKGLLRSNKYTDEDQKTWCVVCLEDATIRCIGCDNDVYCTRCWKDMHVGPSAGYDERGHQWVKFERTAHS